MFKGIGKVLSFGVKSSGKIGKIFADAGGEVIENSARLWGKAPARDIAFSKVKQIEQFTQKHMLDGIKNLEEGLASGLSGKIGLSDEVTKLFGGEVRTRLGKALHDLGPAIEEASSNVSRLKSIKEEIDIVETQLARTNKIAEELDTAWKEISGLGGKADTDVSQILSRVNQPNIESLGKSRQNIDKVISNLRSQKLNYQTQLADLPRAESRLSNLLGRQKHVSEAFNATNNGNYKPVIEKLHGEGGEHMIDVLGEGLATKITNTTRQAVKVNEFTSSNVGNVKKFVEEYSTIAMQNETTAAEFLANPKNAKFMFEISRRYPKLIEETLKAKTAKVPAWIGLAGMSSAKQAAALGVSATAGAIGVITVYNWLTEANPALVASRAEGVKGTLESLSVHGPAEAIVSSANTALNNMISVSKEANEALSDPSSAPDASKKYVNVLSKEGMVLAQALSRWNVVMQNCDDPENAKLAYNNSLNFLENVSNNIAKLNSSVSTIPSVSGLAGKGPTRQEPTVSGNLDVDNLRKVQGFLGAEPTGELDNNTLERLLALERKYNRRAGTNRFSGSFVVPELNYVVPYDKLLKAKEIVEKY